MGLHQPSARLRLAAGLAGLRPSCGGCGSSPQAWRPPALPALPPASRSDEVVPPAFAPLRPVRPQGVAQPPRRSGQRMRYQSSDQPPRRRRPQILPGRLPRRLRAALSLPPPPPPQARGSAGEPQPGPRPRPARRARWLVRECDAAVTRAESCAPPPSPGPAASWRERATRGPRQSRARQPERPGPWRPGAPRRRPWRSPSCRGGTWCLLRQ